MKSVVVMLLIFVATQLFGLYLGSMTVEMMSKGEIQPVVSNPKSLSNSLILFSYILAATAGVIVILKYKKSFLVYIENIAGFFLILTTLSFFFPIITSIGLSIFLLVWTNVKPNIVNKNLCAVLSVSSAGAVIGASFGVLPTLVFCLILTLYDFVSVFITKHMVYLAEEISSKPNMFTVTTQFKGRKVAFGKKIKKINFLALGSGDLFVPLMFSVSVLHTFGFVAALVSIVGATISLFCMYLVLIRRKISKVLPALPMIFLGSMTGFVLSLIL